MTNSRSPHLGPLVSGDEISSELRRRKKTDNYKTVRGSSPALVAKKVKLEQEEGWRTFKQNAKSTRMAKPKPKDEQLEDEVWSLLAQMGFKEMSKGRRFTIAVGEGLTPRQIDVFSKDNETALIVECTRRADPGKRRMAPLIDKLIAIRPQILKSIERAYGRDSKPKVQFVIATRNISWSPADLAKCQASQIAVIRDGDLTYYSALVKHLKIAARYQLLAHLLGGRKVEGLEKQVVATRGRMGGDTFYTFLIRPDDLLRIAYVGHKGSLDMENLETYQRMLQPHRLRKLAEFINQGGKFPTNIVLNLKTGLRSNKKSALQFDKKETYDDETLGVLHLPQNYASAWVIDGQHRLYGYAHARGQEGFNQDSTLMPVLAYENLPPDKEMNLFIDINSKQVKVSKGLLTELYADLHWHSTDPEEAFRALLSRIASRLNRDRTSPLHERVVVAGKTKDRYRCLTQTSIHDGLRVSKLVGTYTRKTGVVPGPLSGAQATDYDSSLEKALFVLSEGLSMFSAALPNQWNLGDATGGYVCTNNGIRALFHVMADVAEHVRLVDHADFSLLNGEECVAELRPYLEALIEYFEEASAQEIRSFRRTGSSLTAVRQQAHGLAAQIQLRIPAFNPPGLQEYLDSRDEEGTEEARTKVMKVQKKLFDYVIPTLRTHFGEGWWTKGIPLKIRKECMNRWEEKDQEGQPEAQLFLLNYIDICHLNWDVFKAVISLDERDKDNRKVCTKWIKELNDIRQITSHPERGILTPEQVGFVRSVAEKVDQYFPEGVG